MNRTSIKIVGQSGRGLLSTGDIMAKSLMHLGFFLNSDREYPSLIKGGRSSYQVDFSTIPVRSLSSETDIMIGFDYPGMEQYINTIKSDGVLIYAHDKPKMLMRLNKVIQEKNIKAIHVPAKEIAFSLGGNELMVNMVLLGVTWKVLGFKMDALIEEVEKRFAKKPKLLEIDLKCLNAGYNHESLKDIDSINPLMSKKIDKKILVNGNCAIALGAIQCGVRNYYAYPMSPASTILTYIADYVHESEMLVKQAEDEITAAQMALGSMYAGSRALVATSGGGFDLMTETISGAAIQETPLVIVIAQRPGPGTGLPTWTAQGDLDLAIHSGHGEFPRAVLACSDPDSCYELTQHAMNIAEEFQTVVILLTEKTIGENHVSVKHFEHKKIPIKRGLITEIDKLEALESADRYKITESGLSKRWLPCVGGPTFVANADEHEEDGSVTEDGEKTIQIVKKRMRKEKLIKNSFPEPKIYGVENDADISFIGWGSTKNAVLDAMDLAKEKGLKVNYLHYEFVWPLKTELLNKFFQDNKNVHLAEQNYRGQLGQIIEDKTKNKFIDKLLKYNGRPFTYDEVFKYAEKNSTK